MTLFAKYEIGIKRYQEGAEDAHGNEVPSWGSEEQASVFSVAPSFTNEPVETGRTPVITGLSILAPTSLVIDPRDVVVWRGVEYTVEGELADWTFGPFSFKPGVQINLKKVDG